MTTLEHPAETTRRALSADAEQLEQGHQQAVSAAAAGLSDSGLGALRLAGTAVPVLAAAAVSSATPFLRAPLLSRISAALRLHPPGGDAGQQCPICHTQVPCATAAVLQS